MAERLSLNLLFTVLLLLSYDSYAKAWIPSEGEYFFSAGCSSTTKLLRDAKYEQIKYYKIEQNINKLLVQKNDLLTNTTLPNYVITQRVGIIDEKIASLRNNQDLIKKQFYNDSAYFSIEKGINPHTSIGIYSTQGHNLHVDGTKPSFANFDIYWKKQVLKKKKSIISIEFAGAVTDFRSTHITPRLGINAAYVKEFKNGNKFITESNFNFYFSSRDHFSENVSQTYEFKSGYFFQLSTYLEYDRNLNYGHIFYYKDQLTVAKRISGDILPFPGEKIISLGIYQDYFHKRRKASGKGVAFGFWLRL